MPRLQRKSFDQPDSIVDFAGGRVKIVQLDESSAGLVVLDPGWRWSKDVQPIAGTASCQNRHFGYALKGRMHIVMDDGTALDIRAGDVSDIPPGHDAWIVGDEQYEEVDFSGAGTYGLSPEELGERSLATILFTDIVDSTATLARLGDAAWQRLLLEHNDRVRHELARFRGREVVTTGDGFLALFDSPARAVRCAVAMHAAVEGLGVRIRAGLHTGEVELVGGNARGLAIHAAARIVGLAGPGETLVSWTTHDLLDGSAFVFEARGLRQLKGLSGPRAVFSVVS
jgi:class 3 adenylate cyclase